MYDIIAKVLKFCAVHLTCTFVGGVFAGNFPLVTTIPSLLLPLLMWGLGVLPVASVTYPRKPGSKNVSIHGKHVCGQTNFAEKETRAITQTDYCPESTKQKQIET